MGEKNTRLLDLLLMKEELKSELSRYYNLKKIKRNEHAKRPPIFCGMTIHPGYGCSLGCLYCYVFDMGIKEVKVGELSGEELVLALSVNPYFLPKETLIAVGSITEPFLKELEEKTYEYIEAISNYLKNPIQISTKKCPNFPERLKEADKDISFLMSFSSFYGELEPKSPTSNRIECLKMLKTLGINTYAFIRPIVPGITEKNIYELLLEFKVANVEGIVLGSLRITPRILETLSRFVNKEEILKRVTRKFRGKNDQVPIKTEDIKAEIRRIAAKIGLRVFPSACAANVDSHNMGCNLCKNGPCGIFRLKDEESIYEFFESRKSSVEIIDFSKNNIVITTNKKLKKEDKILLETYFKVPVTILLKKF